MSASRAFADTHFYLALMHADDPCHERAVSYMESDLRIATSEFIVLELGDACCSQEDHEDFFSLFHGIMQSPNVEVVPVSSELLKRGLDLMKQRPDKDWSLTDCISFTIMNDLDLTDALTGDRHFDQAGFRALLR